MVSKLVRFGGAVVVCSLIVTHVPAQCVVGTNAAVSLDGVVEWVRIPSNPVPNSILDGFTDFTIELWVKTSAPGTVTPSFSRSLVSKFRHISGSTNDDAYAARIVQGGLNVQLGGAAGFTTSGSIDDGVWHHVAIVRQSGSPNAYVDGILQPIISSFGNLSSPLPHVASPLALGAFLDFSDNPLPGFLMGTLDEVRIWNIARTQGQLQATRSIGLTGSEPGLVGYWRFDDGVGQVVTNNATSASTTSPPSLLNGTLGSDGFVGSDDPTWTNVAAPLPYCPGCAGTTPQPNSATAALIVNGQGGASAPGVYQPGPFFVTVPTTGPSAWQLSFSWAGPPGSPLVIVTGVLAPCSLDLACSGRLDISYTSLGILFDGTMAPLNLFFTLGPTGTTSQSFMLPALPPGPVINLQGAVIQPGCFAPVKMTAAFQISI